MMAGRVPMRIAMEVQRDLLGSSSETIGWFDVRDAFGLADSDESFGHFVWIVVQWKASIAPFLGRQFYSRRNIENYKTDPSLFRFLLHFPQQCLRNSPFSLEFRSFSSLIDFEFF